MISSPRFLALGLSLVILWIFIAYNQLSGVEFDLGSDENPEDGLPYLANISREEFIDAAISSAAEDDFDDSHIRAMCHHQHWDSSVVFECDGIIGGIGNIRQEILHCMRYSISAGAGIVLPVINLRAADDLSDLKSGTAPMSYLFDQDRFVWRLKSACPQMPIYRSVDDLKKVGPVTVTEIIIPKRLPHWPTQPAFEARTRVNQLKAPAGNISLIPFQRVWQYFPICHDTVGFANTFGNLIPFRKDVHRLAATALYEMYSRYNLPIDPSITTTYLSANTFLGIHLRTANDILDYWLGYEDQASYYRARIDSSTAIDSLQIVYVASGNATSISDFSVEVQSKTVVTKHDLLFGADLEELASLTWDQQALVDYLILTRSGYFMGMADSSFAWTIAINRRKISESGTCGWAKSVWKSRLWGTAFRDEFSDLMGRHKFGWETRMWP